MAENLVPIEYPSDPDRCQGASPQGQCRYKALPGKKFCQIHISSTARHEEKQNIRNYRLAKYQARIEEFADNQQVKSLREEIGILRMLLEEVILKCTDSSSLVMASNKIADLVLRIEKLVKSCHYLEKSTGFLLDKSAMTQLAVKMIGIIGDHIDDEAKLGLIAEALIREVKNAQPIDS